MAQVVFAGFVAASPKSVEAWEAGRTPPEVPVRRLFALLQRDPQLPDLLKPN